MPHPTPSCRGEEAWADPPGLGLSHAWTALIALALIALLALAALRLTVGDQLLLVVAMLVLRPAAVRQLYVSKRGLLLRFVLLTLGLFISTRYLLWRLLYTLPTENALDFALGLLLFSQLGAGSLAATRGAQRTHHRSVRARPAASRGGSAYPPAAGSAPERL